MADGVERSEATRRLNDAGGRLGVSSGAGWRLVPSLGIAWQEPSGDGVHGFLYQELRSRTARRVALLGRVPFTGEDALGGFAARYFRSVRIEGPRFGNDTLVVLGKRRCKVLDYESRTATAVEQAGPSSISKELEARDGAGDGSVTQILEVDEAAGILVERLEICRNLAVYGSAQSWAPKVRTLLDRWRNGRRRVVDADEHLCRIEEDIGMLAVSSEWSGLRDRLSGSGQVVVELSHGDLQPANILQVKDGLVLTDFEYLGWRAVGYDGATFADGLRWRERDPRKIDTWFAAEQHRHRALVGLARS